MQCNFQLSHPAGGFQCLQRVAQREQEIARRARKQANVVVTAHPVGAISQVVDIQLHRDVARAVVRGRVEQRIARNGLRRVEREAAHGGQVGAEAEAQARSAPRSRV